MTLELHGVDIVSGHPECGTNSMKVYLAVLAEDLDRDDANGPSWNASSCTGVDKW